MTALTLLSLFCAAVPAILFARNLRVFLSPKLRNDSADEVAILIPARDEARNIKAAVEAALSNRGAEVIVLDDSSTDGTAEIVQSFAAFEPRLKLLRSEPLPFGWYGKNWACAQLAASTTRPVLMFVDADVRLAPAAAASLAHWLRENGAQLASGIPRQKLGTFSERLLIPLIHFVLLGFLPLQRMRGSRHPAYATGCGQLVVAEAKSYRKTGGHGAIREKIHDGLALPKLFRGAGFVTDLFDATDLATCRMYQGNAETWRGLSKNTHEGLGAPARIGPTTIILLGGQVLPFVLLGLAPRLTLVQLSCTLMGCALALSPRIAAALRFHQPLGMALLHPFSVGALLAIQWVGLVRFLSRQPTRWKSRSYPRPNSAMEASLTSHRVPAADPGEHFPESV